MLAHKIFQATFEVLGTKGDQGDRETAKKDPKSALSSIEIEIT
jgi:hypothetical protein